MMTRSFRLISLQAFLLLWQGQQVASFTGARIPTRSCSSEASSCHALMATQRSNDGIIDFTKMSKLVASAVIASTLMLGGPAVHADELGISVDAPTMFTGEEVMICKKRGPLGACTKTEARTQDNDNDRAKAYFKDPSDIIKEKQAAMLTSDTDVGNPLIEKLRQQTIDNKEQNDLYVQRKTFENDQSATFGPFDRQVVIMNTDGRTYTMLQNPQAMRLKKAGFIQDRQFIKQPTQDELDGALEEEEGSGGGIVGAIQGIFGGGGGSE